MTKYSIESTTLGGIADAIREKKGTVDPIAVSDFATEISTISGGGDEEDFLYNVGTVNINTGYTHTANTKIELICTPYVSGSYNVLIGARNSTYRNNALVFFAAFNGWKYCYSRTGQEKAGSAWDATSGTDFSWYAQKLKITIDGTTAEIYNYALDETNSITCNTGTADAGIAPLGLFCCNVTTSSGGWSQNDPGYMIFYNLKIYENDVLLHDFVPAYNDSKYCIYDTVAQEYKYDLTSNNKLRGKIHTT